jgi:hypothetical protein
MVYDREFADVNASQLWVSRSGAWLILACHVSDVEDTCFISSGMVVIGACDAYQGRAVVIRILSSR